MDELLKQFIDEARELVEQASKDFLKVEEHPEDTKILNSLFRAMHTLKGSSGIFEFLAPLTESVHAAEDVLDAVRSGDMKLTSDMIDVLLDLLDQINAWLDELEESENISPDAEEVAKEYKEKLRGFLKDNIAQEETEEKSESDKPVDIPWLKEIPDHERREIFKRADTDEIYAITYLADENCFFTGDDPLLTIKNTPSLLWCGVKFKEKIDPDEFDPFINRLNFMAISCAPLEELKEHYQYVEDQIKIESFSLDEIIYPAGEILEENLLESFVEEAKNKLQAGDLDAISSQIKVALEIVSSESFPYSCLKWMQAIIEKNDDKYNKYISCFIDAINTNEFNKEIKDIEVEVKETPEVTEAEEQEVSTKTRAEVDFQDLSFALKLLDSQIEMLNTPPLSPELEEGRILSAIEIVKRSLISLGKKELLSGIDGIDLSDTKEIISKLSQIKDFLKGLEGVEEPAQQAVTSKTIYEQPAKDNHIKDQDLKSSAPAVEKVQKVKPHAKTEIKVLKVDQHRIDSLMELVSELVVAKNSLPYLAKKAEEIFGSKELSKELKFQYATINRICEDLQNEVMQIRMVPLSHVFQRFPRLVRDFSRKLNKKIELVLEGEDTKADKTVVEDLAEPLVHLIRNSIDHGIEPPDERKSLGKPEKGTITLRAIPLEDQVIIEVIDDGKGIDVEKIKQKAYEKGLISEEQLDTISDQDALQYIFAPGLSTAEKISDLSGRGVGMDVVKNMVENVGGSITVFSERNKGTTVRINLPLSMAVTRILMVEVSKELFGFPIENVAETVKIPKQDIKFIKNKETIVLRDRLIPIYRLNNILGLDLSEHNTDDEEVAILIMQVKNTEFGIVVDKFHEGVDIVLKPLEGIMSRYTLYSGATLLGDGRVLLVINPKELVKWL
ncbi:hypothetical protein JCM12298_07560 [Desulfothermus naphthae]